MIRTPTRQDIPTLASIHVQAWDETYRGLLPDEEIDARTLAYRKTLWGKLLNAPDLRTAYAPDIGFAQMGPQRDPELTAKGYDEELYSLYVLAAHQRQGVGRALMSSVVAHRPFSALMVSGNTSADRFYRASGAEHLVRRTITEDGLTFTEDAFGWTPPFAF